MPSLQLRILVVRCPLYSHSYYVIHINLITLSHKHIFSVSLRDV